jgi:hypothetical protein
MIYGNNKVLPTNPPTNKPTEVGFLLVIASGARVIVPDTDNTHPHLFI